MSNRTSNDASSRAGRLAGLGALAIAAALLAGCAGAGPGEVVEPTATEAPPTVVTDDPTESPAPETEAPVEDDDALPEEDSGEAHDDREPVTVAVVGADPLGGGIEVRSFVTDYVGEGECRFAALSVDGEEHAIVVAALPDAQSTVCPTTIVDGLEPGVYSLTVSFENQERFGESEPVDVEVVE